ncbi:MAG: ROK family protein [Synergistaceae bacterium]|jgi:predicted NBD/HSP70 family sugar kinase|nr:ROK family protein [Synergistaceae bacterium]
MGDIVSLKTRNIVNVLHAVKNHAPITKGAISEIIGVTGVSAHNIVNDLLESQMIADACIGRSPYSNGRKAVSYALNPSFGYVIGQRMERGKIETAAYSFDSKRVAHRRADIPLLPPDDTIQIMTDEIMSLMSSEKIRAGEVIGAGVTWPGQVDFEAGVIIDLPNVPNFQGVQVKAIMESRLPFAVYTDNDTKSAALAVKWISGGDAADNFVYIAGEVHGASAAVINEGKLMRGHNNNSGEIGHVNLTIDGELVSIEKCLTDSGLAEKCRTRLIEAGTLPDGAELDMEGVISLADSGDGLVLDVLRRALDVILISVDICVKAYDPNRIFLNIGWLRRMPGMCDELQRMFLQNFSGVSYRNLSLKMLDVEHLDTLGAATLLFDDFFTNGTVSNSLFKYCGEVLKKRGK